MSSGERRFEDGETFRAYRERLRAEKIDLKERLKGRLIWPSREYGAAHKIVADREYYVDASGKRRVAI